MTYLDAILTDLGNLITHLKFSTDGIYVTVGL